MGGLAWMAAAVAAAAVLLLAWWALVHLVWRPRAIEANFRAQGVGGPGYRFYRGNVGDIRRLRDEGAGVDLDVGDHNFLPMVLPHYRRWIPLYGRTFLYWTGTKPTLCIADVKTVKQVLFDRRGLFPKSVGNPGIARLLGKGLFLLLGDDWKRHQKVIHPAFDMDKLKMMTVTMSDCAGSMVSEWEAKMVKGGGDSVEIELSSQFQELTADVTTRTVFGSSNGEGKQILLAQRELQLLAFSTIINVQIPGSRYFPTRNNLKSWKLDRKVRGIFTNIIKSCLAINKGTVGYGNNLLGLMLEACAPEKHGKIPLLNMAEIIEECKTFFLASHDTTAHLLTWTMFLLATHPEWQEKLRTEVLRECGDEVPTSDMISKLKLVNMFLLEALRLYCPISIIQRKAGADLELEGIKVPEGMVMSIPIAMIHRDKEVWGEDADEFKPTRFENGVTRAAKHPNAVLAFSGGPRVCIGQNFAMIQAKVVIAMILHRFAFSLSPKYVHAPTHVFTLQAKFGLPMLLKRLEI